MKLKSENNLNNNIINIGNDIINEYPAVKIFFYGAVVLLCVGALGYVYKVFNFTATNANNLRRTLNDK